MYSTTTQGCLHANLRICALVVLYEWSNESHMAINALWWALHSLTENKEDHSFDTSNFDFGQMALTRGHETQIRPY